MGEAYITTGTGEEYQLTVYEAGFSTPSALKGGVMYQIFPDRFLEGRPKPMPFADRIYRENKSGEPYFWPTEQVDGYLTRDYFGGDFEGIRRKLPYLAGLGVTTLYLNPIFEAHSNHRYNTANYLKADPLLGTNEEFARLCAEAKQQGISIILDGVFSHTGSDSIYFNRECRYPVCGACNSPDSPYRRWYDFFPGLPMRLPRVVGLRHAARGKRKRRELPPVHLRRGRRHRHLALPLGPAGSVWMWPMSFPTILSEAIRAAVNATARINTFWAKCGRTPPIQLRRGAPIFWARDWTL